MRVLVLICSAAIVASGSFAAPALADWRSGILSIPNEKIGARPKSKPVSRPSRTTRARNRTVARAGQRRVRRSPQRGRSMRGIASYYWQPQRVASGGWFNPNALTAAHKTLRFGTRVRVTNLRNGRSVIVRINDRGPYIKGRIIDLSRRAADIVGMRKSGIAPVRVDIL